MLTEEQKNIHKEFRSYLRTVEGKKGNMLNYLISATEKQLPALLRKHISTDVVCIYDDIYSMAELLACASKIHSDDEILADPFGYISSQSLDAYIRFYTQKHGINIQDLRPKEESDSDENDLHSFTEGTEKDYSGVKYERDSEARKACIKHYDCKCVVCGIDFEKEYGELGKGFIEVHHIVPISQRGGEYVVDPIKDLRPLCPNCHSMIHRKRDNVLSVEKLKHLFEQKHN